MKLYNFQEKILEQTKDYNRVLYALEMGLGKTFIGAEKAHSLLKDTKCILVVCQKSKVEDWFNHFADNYTDCAIYDLTQKADSIDRWFLDMTGAPTTNYVGIINYELIFRREKLLGINNRSFTLLLDESSMIQNATRKRSRFILKLKPKNVILLSGTVVNGSYEKLWSQCTLLGWDITKRLFWNQYVNWKTIPVNGAHIKVVTGYKNVDRLKLKLREHGAVFMKSSEAIDLPKQVFNYIWCDNTKEYLKFDRDKIIEIDGKRYSADFKLSERVIKRYLCSRAKLGALKDIINSTDDRLIIFYNFNEELAKIKEAIKDRPISVVNGDIKDLEAYEKHSNSITLIQYIAGSFGLNLQLANKIIYFSLPDGGAEMFDQSIKRIHRIGQDRTCFYYILAVKNSIETEIINNLKLKSQRINNLFEKSL